MKIIIKNSTITLKKYVELKKKNRQDKLAD